MGFGVGMVVLCSCCFVCGAFERVCTDGLWVLCGLGGLFLAWLWGTCFVV